MNIGNAVFIFLLYQKNVFQYDILSDDTWLVRCTLNPTQYIIDLLCADIHVCSIAHLTEIGKTSGYDGNFYNLNYLKK